MTQSLNQETINAFVIAAHHDLARVQEMLGEHPALLNENADWIETPIQAAAHTGSRNIAEYLLAQGAPLDICTAAMLNLPDEVQALLQDDPGLYEAVGAHNIPVMYFAAIGGSPQIAETLLGAGSNINEGAGGNTALHGAAGFGQTAMVGWLLDHGADPNAADYNGKTPLEVAEQTGHAAAADLLRPVTTFEESEPGEDA
jgi:ankyrin repeat protein